MKSPAFAALILGACALLGARALTVPPAAAEAAALRKKLGGVAAALEGMLTAGKPGGLASSPAAPELRAFLGEVRGALVATDSEKDPAVAVRRLKAAQAGMSNLTAALSAQQSTLMRQGEEDESSLVLGVLMSERGQPMKKQLEVLKSADFKDLPVSKALLAQHDESKPLFEQAAAFMDKHGSKAPVEDKAAKLAKTIDYFANRADILEKEEARATSAHNASGEHLEALIKKSSKEEAHKLELMKHQSDRDFRKRMLKHSEQRKLMENVLAALRRGDSTALAQAQAALQASVKRMQQRTGDFLHLIQLGSRLESRDCPYCAAQCIDKCHTAGNPYATCLAECADAGK